MIRRFYLFWSVIIIAASTSFLDGQTYRYYGAHVTDQPPWINKIVVYNNGGQDADFQITVWDADGQVFLQEEYTAPANSSKVLVMSNFAGYIFTPGEVELVPVEGTLVIETQSQKIRPKLSFRYGDSESLTEFFLQDTLAWEYILPNTIQGHFSWTGIALMNPYNDPLSVMIDAYQDGALQGQREEDVPANTKYVRLSDGIWPGLLYMDFDQVKISSADQAFPPPMSITGNNAQGRHVFFNAAVTLPLATCSESGGLYELDSILGNLRCVLAGTFVQGSPEDESCRDSDEAQFTHTLTQNIVVMETEVTRQMWADLKAVQSSLPSDPTNLEYGSGMNNPVQNVTWTEAALFANLLSLERGLTRCYYMDAAFTTPVTAENYTPAGFYCNFNANGYRLPTEGEWEYFCRAGTTGPFWVNEPNYNSDNCEEDITTPGTWPNLEAVAWFCANRYDPAGNDTTKPVGLKEANSWGLRDVHGNLWEWCWDMWGTYPSENATDYEGPESGWGRVKRGGSRRSITKSCRSSYRDWFSAIYGATNTGFRLVRNIESP